ncbi:BCD family MFS transporter [Jannaschia sp. KMU-145]|uniref:BCD family MFS transporter n=1 Tax=Jannaschia halovivens TaxID=3388667 RepID=UPI00396B1277
MLSWIQIARFGLVQMALGSIVVLTTSTLNRLMVVELSLPAVLPGLLVGLHYGIQVTRPGWGYRSDVTGNRTRWIVGGMAALGLGAVLAAFGIVVLADSFTAGLALSVVAYTLIGLGVGASGTSLLALLASATAPRRRAAAATITWLMMILGIALTAGVIGQLLDPYTPARLLKITGALAVVATLLAALAMGRIERGVPAVPPTPAPKLMAGLAEVWAEPRARAFTLFVFLSMTAYFMQELILEPYAGLAHGFTPGQSTSLSGAQNGGVFIGMVTVGIMATGLRIGGLRHWVIAGCLGSALALAAIAAQAPLLPATIALGFFNGMFAVAAIGAMMALAGEGRASREGTRMGLWGAAQAVAAGFGGLTGAALADLLRTGLPDAQAFGTVFVIEAGLFLLAALMATRTVPAPTPTLVPGE